MAPSTRINKERLAAILSGQLDVITREQALAAGLTKHALQHRLRDGGSWQRLLPGVYFTRTGTPSQGQREMAALLYGGVGSMVTGPAALPCHRIRGPQPEFVDVLVAATCQRRDAEFVRVHRTTRLPECFYPFGPVRYALAARAVGDTGDGDHPARGSEPVPVSRYPLAGEHVSRNGRRGGRDRPGSRRGTPRSAG